MATGRVSALPLDFAAALPRVQGVAAALVSRPWVWLMFVGTMFALPLTKAFTRDLPLPPPVLGAVPAFELVRENGETLNAAGLRGHVWIAEFGRFGSDAAREERMEMLLTVQHRMRNMGETARIVSVSVDPEHDTSAHLRTYANDHKTNPYVWTFLTGDTPSLHAELSAGLRDAVRDLLPGSTLADSGYLVLVDPDLRVRGYYPPTTGGVDALVLDMGLIANLYTPEASEVGAAS